MSDGESENYANSRTRSRTRVQAARQELICPICIETFTEPRTLPCQHTFCTACLQQLEASKKRPVLPLKSPDGGDGAVSSPGGCGEITIACPECRANISLPEENGVLGLPKNFKLERIIEILSPGELEELNRGSARKKRTFRCLTHSKSADYFCTTCNRLACGDCLLEQHLNHQGVKHSREVLTEHIEALKELLPGAKETLKSGEMQLSAVDSLSETVKQEGVDAIQTVKDYFVKIHNLLKKRQSELEREVLDQIQKSCAAIDHSASDLHESLEEFQFSTQELEDAVKKGSFDILVKEDELRSRLESSKKALEVSCSEVTKLENLSIKPPPLHDTKLEVFCRTLAAKAPVPLPRKRQEKQENLTSPQPPPSTPSPCPSPCPSPSIDPRLNSVDADYTLTPDMWNKSDEEGGKENEDIYVTIPVPEPPLRNESYRATHVIIKPEVIFNSQNMSSTFFQAATSSVYPRGVCCGVSGTILVTDVQNHCVRILASTGKCLDVIGREGKGDGMFGEPTAVTTDRDGNLLVCDLCPARLQKFSPQGSFISKHNSRFLRGNPLGEPWAVAVSHNGTIYVSDWDKSCIHLYNENGRYQSNFGSGGTDTPLKYPAGIAIDKRGRIIVADRGNHVVCIYTPEGNLLNRFGKAGRAPGELYFPFGVAISKDGANIYISESGNHRISVFDSHGHFLRCFGKKGTEPGTFHLPRHMWIDSNERLMVADEQNQRIQIFASY